jgi:high affinity sulfate transporter 1
VVIEAPRWLATYDRSWLTRDLVAGITLAAYLLPAAIGDASLAGMTPQAGLYSCLFAGSIFWLFCSSRVTAISITSALSLLIGATLGPMSAEDPSRHAALAACTAVMVSVIALLAYAANAGTAINFLSETVLVGFKIGVGFYLAATQLPKLFGIPGTHGDFWENMEHLFRSLGQTNPAALLLGASALALLIGGKIFLKNRPVALIVLVLGIVAAGSLHLDRHGVALLGDVPTGLPHPGLPTVTREDVDELMPLALACFLLAAVETSAIGRMFAGTHGYRLDASQEFLAIAAANLAAGLFRGFPVSGGTSQSLVNESAGARTPLSGLVAALITLVVALFLTGLLKNLPQPVVAAIVLAAVTGLVDVSKLREIWRFSGAEFAVAVAAILGVLGSGLLNGVLIGAGLSMVLLVRRASRPRVTEIARVPGTAYFSDIVEHPQNERVAGVLVLRPEGSILYFNADHVREQVLTILGSQEARPRLVVLFLGNVPHVDMAGAELLFTLRRELATRGIELRLAEVHLSVRDAVARAAAAHMGDPPESHRTVDDAVARWKEIEEIGGVASEV